MERAYYRRIWEALDREKSMVFVSGPRQAGKTTLAKQVAATQPAAVYLNYDIPADKARVVSSPAFFEEVDCSPGMRPLVVLDEIHKMSGWKDYAKGVYDGYGTRFRFLVTGSGRLDLLHSSGESLAGRYLQFRLLPFTLGELFADGVRDRPFPRAAAIDIHVDRPDVHEAWETLRRCGGFPEPFLRGREISYRRWANAYHRQILREDIRDAFAVRNIDSMETLYALLAPRVGGMVSASSLANQLRVSHSTVESWLRVFERFMLVFRLRPFSAKISRALLRQPKCFFYDAARAADPGARLENLVALELRRAVASWTDFGLGDYGLWFVRTKDGEEVDFLVTRDRVPQFLVEVKSNDVAVAPALRRFQDQLAVPAVQLVDRPGTRRVITGEAGQPILVVTAASWLAALQ